MRGEETPQTFLERHVVIAVGEHHQPRALRIAVEIQTQVRARVQPSKPIVRPG